MGHLLIENRHGLIADAMATVADGYAERLSVAWWIWPCALATAALLAAEVHLGYDGLRAWVPYAVLLPLTLALLAWLSRLKIEILP